MFAGSQYVDVAQASIDVKGYLNDAGALDHLAPPLSEIGVSQEDISPSAESSRALGLPVSPGVEKNDRSRLCIHEA
jgi:hypothetical protein